MKSKLTLLSITRVQLRNFLSLLKAKIECLRKFPYTCPIYEDDPNYRKLVVGDYLVFYMVNEEDKTVEIHRIFHGSREIKKQLDPRIS